MRVNNRTLLTHRTLVLLYPISQRCEHHLTPPNKPNRASPLQSLSASAVTFCIHCGREIEGGDEDATSCSGCESIRRVKLEIYASEERPRCLWCDSGDVRPILYGTPSEAMWQMCEGRHAVWGGCPVDGHEPQWACESCHRNFGVSYEARSFYCNLCGRPSSKTWCSECCAHNKEESTYLPPVAFKEFERQETGDEVIRVVLFGLALVMRGNQDTGMQRL